MYQQFQVLYSIGSRDDFGIVPSARGFLLETVVSATDPVRAREMVEAMNGGSDHCVVNLVLPL